MSKTSSTRPLQRAGAEIEGRATFPRRSASARTRRYVYRRPHLRLGWWYLVVGIAMLIATWEVVKRLQGADSTSR